ncbi:MAG TPA: class II aldolase/adducin family protein [Spirochaetota bacterium]|nr:class II aldolase/adducin family protein [Spirochaetota bacterium]
MNKKKIKKNICHTGYKIWQKGWCAANDGNITVKIKPDKFLATASGISKGSLKPAMVLAVNQKGAAFKKNKYRVTSEIKVHMAVYNKIPQCNAVIHSHSPYATVWAVAGQPLPEALYPEAEIMLGRVELAPYALQSTAALADKTAAVMSRDTGAVLMANHGCLTCGRSLAQAYERLEVLESYCRLLILLKKTGKAVLLSEEEISRLITLKKKLGFRENRNAAEILNSARQKLSSFLNE